jgi:hypothetical protein
MTTSQIHRARGLGLLIGAIAFVVHVALRSLITAGVDPTNQPVSILVLDGRDQRVRTTSLTKGSTGTRRMRRNDGVYCAYWRQYRGCGSAHGRSCVTRVLKAEPVFALGCYVPSTGLRHVWRQHVRPTQAFDMIYWATRGHDISLSSASLEQLRSPSSPRAMRYDAESLRDRKNSNASG